MFPGPGWGRPAAADPPAFEQILGTRDCDPAIGALVLCGDVARLFAPPRGGHRSFDYNATFELSDGRRVAVRVHKAGRGRETLLRDGWRDVVEDFDLMPGDLARFEKSLQEDSTFTASFRDPDGHNLVSHFEVGDDPPSSPEFRIDYDAVVRPLSSPEIEARRRSLLSKLKARWKAQMVRRLRERAAGAPAWREPALEGGRRRGEQAAGAAAWAWGEPALPGDDMTVKEAMDLAVECGAREGSDEHYMATKLFVKAENRAMFGTFRSNAGRLQWFRRCYEDRMN